MPQQPITPLPPPNPVDPLHSPLFTEFPTVADIKTAFLLSKDFTKRHFPMIAYKTLLTTDAELDDVHGEIAETAKRWSAPFWVRAFVVAEVLTQPLTKFGLEEKRDAEIYLTVPDMADAGILTLDLATYDVDLKTQGIGDHFFYRAREYEIRQFVPYSRFANTDRVLYYAATAEMYRQVSANVTGLI